MIKKPKFNSYFKVKLLESAGVFLLSENNFTLLEGRVYLKIAPLINGNSTSDEIIEALKGEISPAEVYYALMQMERKSYIIETETTESIPSAIAEFCHPLNIEAEQAYKRLQETTVKLSICGQIPIDSALDLLQDLQVKIYNDVELADIEVVFTSDYLHPALKNINQKALTDNRPWMLVKPIGTIIWIGPIFSPKKTGCWECLAERLRGNRPVESFIQNSEGNSAPVLASNSRFPPRVCTGLSLAVHELFKWIVLGQNERLQECIVTFNTLSLKIETHSVVRRPQCLACGNKPQNNFFRWQGNRLIEREFNPPLLQSRKKNFVTDGGHREVSPEDTFKTYQHHISPITGVVRRVEPFSLGGNGLLHSYIAPHHFAVNSLSSLRQNLQGRSGGKGKTSAQAKASALCEAIERYSLLFQGEEIRVKGSYQELKGVAIHPNECMNFSPDQYKNRAIWNSNCAVNLQVPEPFDECREIEWTPVWSLTYHHWKYLPTAYCYFGYSHPNLPDCWADSNGSAAGNSLEEAILQGFMELVERDSVALWWYNRVQRPVVNLESFNEPYFLSIRDYYHTQNRDLWVLDITSDLKIPAFAAISTKRDSPIEDIIFGFGAHFDATLAVLRAISEVNQSLPAVWSVDSTSCQAEYPPCGPQEIDWWKTTTLENQSYLIPDAKFAAKLKCDYPQHFNEDILKDVMNCVDIVKQKGMEMLVLDVTRPDIGLPVVKVIVPGMRHFWTRFAPGRLYHIPVEIGWLPAPLSETELNPLPLSF